MRLNLTETHKTVQNIKARGAFTVSIADAAHIVEADYFGVESGNKVADKFARSGLTASKAETVDAPVINEFPICLECKFIEYQNNEYGCGVIGKVVNVTADESVMVDGKIDMSKVNAIAFDPYTHGYYKVTERVGEAFRRWLKAEKVRCAEKELSHMRRLLLKICGFRKFCICTLFKVQVHQPTPQAPDARRCP